MERGLIWLPLLGLIIGLTWVGWKEYQKVEGYRIWSEQFEKAKYDIYAVMGLKDNQITWGKPTPQGISGLEIFSLQEVADIKLSLGDRLIDINNLPTKKTQDIPQLTFNFRKDNKVVKIPFTEAELAAKWQKFLSSNINH
ncbi:conserved hypothetical protein [Hyella patelloides LEGE 07179]|uniref:Uncharacterized protein n=1 Tax=Hyella patelloides LEGE 07179 TaxID=945734 RepID=A0A563W441_9CYAN|nr:hypothetical protein [Hyella patelloides]VEP18313.1 conserved hypothetical protein [Hyella patelloides LEGE 07179]